MCGIAGIWERSGRPVEAPALERMATVLAHRGPDGSGFHLDGSLGLANRRLRILDLSAAADQPMGLPDGSLWLTFNGEIHNYLELRRELESRGAGFRTHSDTEVVLHAYAAWGTDCFERFNGMWALALWDAGERRLVLSRDRFGIKPLCYSSGADRLCFASEPKAIIAAFPECREPDDDEIGGFLSGAFPDAGEATFFRRIKNLPAASYAVCSADAIRIERYWSFQPGDERPRPEAEERFRSLLGDAVRLRTRSDVPIGACLSGGLDSSSIVGLLDHPGPIHCFSTRFEGSGHDESRYAALAAGGERFALHWVRPDPAEMLETIRRIVWHHDAPTPIRGRFAQWFVMREAGRHVKVVLDGQGGDELLGGYAADTVFYLRDRIRSRSRARPDRWLPDLIREGHQLAQVDASLRWYLLMGPRRYLLDPRTRGPRPYTSELNNVLWNGLCRDGLPELLHSEDALSMAFSVESRTPFLDHRLVELCFSLPFDEKISGGWTKSLLRRSMAGVVPAEILGRRGKYGFGAPVTEWLQLEPNATAVRELLLDPRALERGLFRRGSVERFLKLFHDGPSRYAAWGVIRLWRWITLELWFREFVDGAAR